MTKYQKAAALAQFKGYAYLRGWEDASKFMDYGPPLSYDALERVLYKQGFDEERNTRKGNQV